MQETEAINYIAWWGAILSTVLASVKLWELWRDRFRINVGYSFSSDSEHGNEIYVRNLGSKPIIISYWQVLYGRGIWPARTYVEVQAPGPETCDIRITPNSSTTFTFSRGRHFWWGKEELQGRKIYMRLHIAGMKPVLKKVYR